MAVLRHLTFNFSAGQKPGASIAVVVLQHGMNANLLHRWRKAWAQGLHRLEGRATTAVATPQASTFIPIELSRATCTIARVPRVTPPIPTVRARKDCAGTHE